MKKLFTMCFGFGIGLVAMFLAFEFHVVRAESDWHFVRKQETQLTDFYADIRKWDRDEWERHPDLQEALVAADKSDLLPAPQPEELIDEAIQTWETARRVYEAVRK